MYFNSKIMKLMCLRKKKFKTYEFALKIANEMTKKYGIKQNVYFCPLCQNYHLTTKTMEGKNNDK